MGRYYRTVQEIHRSNPDYKYVVEIRTSGGLFGGYDVTVQGLAKNNPNVDDNENFISEYYWKRPSREKLMRLVDMLHVSVRSSMAERDWKELDQAEMQRKLEELKAKMDAEFAAELERRLKLEAERIKKEQEGKEPMKP